MVRQIKHVQCPECGLKVKSEGGLKRHIEAKHAEPQPDPPAPRFPTPDLNSFNTPPPQSHPPSPIFSSRRSPRRRQNGSPVCLQWSAAPLDLRKYGTHVEMAHPILDGTPCDQNGYDLPENSLPAPVVNDNEFDDWAPFQNATEFKLAEFLYHKVQMSAGDIDTLSQLISELMAPERSDNVPFHNHREMYGLIDAIRQGEIQWESFTVKFNGDLPEDQSPLPAWKQQEYHVWFRDPLAIMEQMLANPSFKTEMDVSPKRLFKNGKRLYWDLMTGNWAWTQCDEIAEDKNWVFEYIDATYSKQEASQCKADIDRRISITSPYAGLRQFHEGRGFKQWTGDDSKGLMKIFLPAIVSHVPPQMVRAVADFMEFCYLVRRSVIDEDALNAIDDAVSRFHRNREIFRTSGIRPDGFSLPRQHSMIHYRPLIQQFGAPNGLCSSITESKHIKAVKRPWRRSSHNKPLGQMLLTNQRLDKLAAYRVDLESRDKLQPPKGYLKRIQDSLLPPLPPDNGDNEDEGPVDEPFSQGDVKLSKRAAKGVLRTLTDLAVYVSQPSLPVLIRHFLYNQRYPDAPLGQRGCDVPIDQCPNFLDDHPVYLHNSAQATFFAPSDMSGLGGMRRERLRAVKSWFGGAARYDCVFMEGDTLEDGFSGLLVGRVFMFFRFSFEGRVYPCALIHWFSTIGNGPCDLTGLWMVQPDFDREGNPNLEVIHLDCIYRGAHLIGITGDTHLPATGIAASDSLDAYEAFYVNKYIDYHAHEIAF
ncbi:hypothetical protein D9758_013775 [Tetrapyrgos nigripes]|uniref:C2H2-type domain-containing protein n=1 Tax=Tetrapyrgos nigripes TaxID=182062 RepID=A0A8H5D4S4_9AGAR|nr:hypothetical protein D9758_013775 [Tetrapyrgos nigripes]